MTHPLSWKVKVGLAVVSSSTVNEGRLPRVVPSDIGFFTSRMLMAKHGVDALKVMEANARRAFEELATIPVDAIAYCCTVSGALRGLCADRKFCESMSAEFAIPVTSTMLAVTEALCALRLQRIVVTSPYVEGHHEPERAYFRQAGIEPIAMHGMGISDGREFAKVAPEEIMRFCLEKWDSQADGLFISCMNFDALPVVDELERRIGKPVVTSHSATLWRALGLAGFPVRIPGLGRLMS